MKHFFIIFFLFFMLFAKMPAAQEIESVEYPAFLGAATLLQEVAENVRTSYQKNAEELTPGKMSFLDWLMADEKSVSPLTGQKGIGAFQQTPFGRVRLLSCLTGIKDKKDGWFTIDTEINPGWTIQNPVFHLSESAHIQNSRFYLPFILPLSDKSQIYMKNASFPFHLDFDKSSVPIQALVHVSFKACFEAQCQKTETTLPLFLDETEARSSSFCPYIRRSFESIPLDRPDLTAVWLEKGILQISVQQKKQAPQKHLLLLAEKTVAFEELETFINNETLMVKVKPEIELNGKALTLVFHDGSGLYQNTVQVQAGEEIKPFYPKESFSLFLLTLGFVFFSPMMTLLLTLKLKNEWAARGQSHQLLLEAGIAFGLALLFFTCMPESLYLPLYSSYFWLGFCFLLFGFFLFSSKMNGLQAGILTCLCPLTFLYPLWMQWPKSAVVLYLGLIALSPLLFFYIKPATGVYFSLLCRSLPRWLKKLPLIGAMVAFALMMTSLYWNQKQALPDLSAQALHTEINNGKIVDVFIAPQWCFSCTLFQFFSTHTGLAYRLQKAEILKSYHLSPAHPMAKAYQNKFGKVNGRMHLLFGPENKDGINIPFYLRDQQMPRYFNAVFKES